ncbi:hypothetical protein DM01DRAFT_1340493 [Hesseltinella vesiculosa]|uniref:Uncharacterized protein n=1 Tax=Hesseltinella vesiculosa TaxID=101127 RepID=A0A1X2G3Y3_9FUNG|nr:hypothetical protein DM01DRAFT_1340493 [Hesseltinella vesiculosa]
MTTTILLLWAMLMVLSIHALPVPSSEPSPDCDNLVDLSQSNYRIHLDQLVDHITTHWKYDHLDRIQQDIIYSTSQLLQDHFQMSLATPSDWNDQPSSQIPIQQHHGLLETMDSHILIAQIKDAVQAHTQSRLPLAWDEHGDPLSKMALTKYLKTIISDQCASMPASTTMPTGDHKEAKTDDDMVDQDAMISAACLSQHADQLSASLDHYLGTHLLHLLDIMDQNVLPDLIDATAGDLDGLVSYFNHVFFVDSLHTLQLQVKPWQSSIKTVWLDTLLPTIDQDMDGSSHYFTRYACLARISP